MARTGGALPDKILRATCDGVRSCGEIVRGEQVTAEVMADSFTTGNVTPRKTTLRLVFGSDRRLLALIAETPRRRLLHGSADPADPVPVRRMLSGSVYWLERGEPVLAHT